jgi:cytochrome c-type biogenesis protein CcmH/NrfF
VTAKRFLLIVAGTGVALLAAVLLSISLPTSVPTPGQQAYQLSAELMSPFCPGLTLAACPSPNAQTVRAEIAERFRQGESREAIVADLIARYGEGVQASPSASGVGLIAWLLPAAAGVITLAVLIAAVRSVRRRRVTAIESARPVPIDAAMARRLEDELDQLG